jgi:CheY-like chemotaxis protein
VLVVDDEPDSAELLEHVLASCAAAVRTASSAAHAVEVLEAWGPDVLVSDIGMPGGDGYALNGRVRALASERVRRIPAVAVTAYARPEDRLRILSAGFQAHLSKPVDPAELVALVASPVRSHRERRSGPRFFRARRLPKLGPSAARTRPRRPRRPARVRLASTESRSSA